MTRDADTETRLHTRTTSDKGQLWPIGAVARELGLTPRAIRYYEEIGLLRPAVRVKGSDRLFDASDLERLRRIKQLREVIGFSLSEIAELLDDEDVRTQLRARYYDAADAEARIAVLNDAIALTEHRLAMIQRKLDQVEAVRAEEGGRLAQLRERLAEEQARTGADTADVDVSEPGVSQE